MILKIMSKLVGALVCAACLFLSVSCAPTTERGPAEVAYELRINGKLDEAKQVLEDALSQDPGYADGHYELARVKSHMAFGDPRQTENLLTEALQSINRAVALDSSSVIYTFFAGHVHFVRAFFAMHMGEADAAERAARSCDSFTAALRLDPDYREAMLYLVELYGVLPVEMGGDRSKAEVYRTELAAKDEIYGMKARSILSEVGVADWKELYEKHPGNTDVLEELGKAYLRKGNVAEADKFFEEAVAIDSSQVILFLDLGRYHFGSALEIMESEEQETLQRHWAAAESAILRYLESEHPAPMKAYALRMLSKVKHGTGDKGEGDNLKAEAKALDPFHSRATGNPPAVLFTPPGMIEHDHRYLMRPF